MGCGASRLDNEDTVRRCKERRRLMKEAVFSRHHFSAAHSDYLDSLRRTGSALTNFAAGEPLSVSEQTPPVLLHHRPFEARAAISSLPPPTPSSSIPPPPHPRPQYSPSITNSKLPHILSDSSMPSTPSAAPKPAPKRHSNRFNPSVAKSSYAATPSQTSSVWDWDNFYPPSHPAPISSINSGKRRKKLKNRKTKIMQTSITTYLGRNLTMMTMSMKARPGAICTMDRYDLDSASVGWNARDESSAADDLRLVVHHRDLAEIVASLEEYFIKAASAGDSVSDLLEIGRAQFERSFRQLKKTVYHSNSVLSALSSSWSSKPPLAIKYRFDAAALAESCGEKSHVSTLERLLAWEKKLYEEVKAREGVKIEHEKKLSALQSQEYKGKDDAKLDKTKASINKLQSLIIVTSQAVSTTSSAITAVRDTELAPQLIEICHG
ncbi:hypothetical protein HPP92_026112 [Vanilla planifolia]|uniref:Uncharacterized protein n=1 Tax=Vanilla planifolia TaxID=51239 RepID=A0A835U6Q3_VANPL|nr:hypothetical protein HPP92_026112 [Vanilla planifolia]